MTIEQAAAIKSGVDAFCRAMERATQVAIEFHRALVRSRKRMNYRPVQRLDKKRRH